MEITLENKVKLIIEWLAEKKAENISYIDVLGKTNFTDAIIICNGSADIHNRAIADHVMDCCYEHKFRILSKEGLDSGRWVLIDLGDVIIHIFNDSMRDYYKLESLYTSELIKRETEDYEN